MFYIVVLGELIRRREYLKLVRMEKVAEKVTFKLGTARWMYFD